MSKGTIPPFIGYSNLNDAQKEDRLSIFGKNGGTLDYVSCWYKKSADYMRGNHIRAALVSTNSICQGQQVAPLWKPLFADGIHIDFAYRTFVWDSQADDVAHVHVIIVGFSRESVAPKILFDGDSCREVANINGYLSDAPDAFVEKTRKPISDVTEMFAGFKPAEHGTLLLSRAEKDEMVLREPSAEKWIRPFSMGAEFIRGEDRYCLWLVSITPRELKEMPLVMERVQACKEWRSTQIPTGDAYKLRDVPHLLRPNGNFVDGPNISVAKVSSGRRKYVPMAFVTNGMIPGDSIYFIPNGTLYEFGILMSQFHNAWMRTVAGRLKSDYRYTNTIVYNTFVWPDSTPQQHEIIESCAQAIIDARDFYAGCTLADLYDPDDEWMYPELVKAHRALDAAVEDAYGVDFNGNEEKIVAHLFKLYAEKTAQE